MNIIVMAGTSDARKIIEALKEIPEVAVTATTTTHYGSELAESSGAVNSVPKAMNEEELLDLIKKCHARVLIDATHPFAVNATKTAIKACERAGIPYIRFERPAVETDGVIEVGSFTEAGKVASSVLKEGDHLMHLAGISTLGDVLESVPPDRVVVRVLPYASSVEACLQACVPGAHIIAMQGTFSRELNRALMRDYRVGAVITKDSGESGGLKEKIQAANDLGIPVILVKRPALNLENRMVFQSVEKLVEYVKDLKNSSNPP